MLAGRWRDPGDLAAAFRDRGSLRVDGLLDEAIAGELLEALRAEPHRLTASAALGLAFQYFSHAFVPDADCDHVLCRFGRWLHGDGAAWVASIVGRRLGPPVDRQVVATHYERGSFLDPHNDWDGARQIAFVYGLTSERWPAGDGGHLEFLDARGAVIERREPGWNTLDLFDVSAPTRPHRIPIVTRSCERRAISGWLYGPAADSDAPPTR